LQIQRVSLQVGNRTGQQGRTRGEPIPKIPKPEKNGILIPKTQAIGIIMTVIGGRDFLRRQRNHGAGKTAAQRAITVRPVDKATAMTTPSLSTLNQLIQYQREAKGYSLSELAQKLGITTESLRDLEDYPDEINEAPVWLARKLSSLLDIPPEQFFS